MVKTVCNVVLLIFIAVSAALVSCEGTSPTDFDRDAIIVQANLYSGYPVNDIRLSYMAKTIRDTLIQMQMWNYERQEPETVDTIIPIVTDRLVNDARITLTNNNDVYECVFSGSDGRYKEESGILLAVAGETYRIDVYADGRHAWAETTVPLPVSALAASRDTLYSVQQDEPYDGREPAVNSSATIPDSLTNMMVKWNNPEKTYLYVYCKPVTPAIETYFLSRIGTYTILDYLTVTSLSSDYNTGPGGSDLTSINIADPGRYKLIIYSTPPDYSWMQYARSDTSSLKQDQWIRSATNINGGLGLFASFGVDSIFIDVVPWVAEER